MWEMKLHEIQPKAKLPVDISPEKEVELLQAEWTQLERSTEWNFELIEKHRNYGFVFIAAIFGATGSDIASSATLLWLVVPPIIVILISRMVVQLEFIAIRLSRRNDIETRLRLLTGNNFLFCMESMFSTDQQSTSVYVLTYIHIFVFFIAVFVYSLLQAYELLTVCNFILYSAFFGFSLLFIGYRVVMVTFKRIKKKRTLRLAHNEKYDVEIIEKVSADHSE